MPLIYSSSSPLGNVIYKSDSRFGTIQCEIPRIPFASGEYTLNVAITHPNVEYIDEVEDAACLRINSADPFGTGAQYSNRSAPIYTDNRWYPE